MQVPIVTLWKHGKPVDFNASDLSDMLSQGWEQSPTKPALIPAPVAEVEPQADKPTRARNRSKS